MVGLVLTGFIFLIPATDYSASSTPLTVEISHDISVTTISVMTWNVWFSADFFAERMKHIIDTVLELEPDVANFQEVLGPFHKMMRENEVLMEKYEISDPGHSYYVATLTKRSLQPKFSITTLPTSMGRELLVSSFVIDGESIGVGNVHLESLKNHPLREEQLTASRSALAVHSASVLVGDFNFCSEKNFVLGSAPLENDSLQSHLAGYIDVWPAVHPPPPVPSQGEKAEDTDARAAHGYTFDSERNGNLELKRRREVARYDRVMLHSSNEAVRPLSIELIGTDPVANIPAEEHVFPSDHFGLLAQFTVKN